jgi:hypothetical protein
MSSESLFRLRSMLHSCSQKALKSRAAVALSISLPWALRMRRLGSLAGLRVRWTSGVFREPGMSDTSRYTRLLRQVEAKKEDGSSTWHRGMLRSNGGSKAGSRSVLAGSTTTSGARPG